MSWSKVIASLCMFKERRKILTKFRNEFDVESSSLLDGDENFVNLDGLISSVRPINVADTILFLIKTTSDYNNNDSG